jgi:hypothetical protein
MVLQARFTQHLQATVVYCQATAAVLLSTTAVVFVWYMSLACLLVWRHLRKALYGCCDTGEHVYMRSTHQLIEQTLCYYTVYNA